MKNRYNKSEILRNAWVSFRSSNISFSQALKSSWAKAKNFKSINEWVAEITAINPATNAYADGGLICGYYRGKRSEGFKFMVSSRKFVCNDAGGNVTNVFKQVGLI